MDLQTEKANKFSVVFGPNGKGKSNLLHAIGMVANPKEHTRDCTLAFRKFNFHVNYDPTYSEFQETASGMEVEGVFLIDGEVKTVELNHEGLVSNSLPPRFHGYAFTTDADHPMKTANFQLEETMADIFLDMAKTIYGYSCEFTKSVREKLTQNSEPVQIFTDFVIHKEDEGSIVHFKRMSDGEKKIATLLAMLCNPLNMKSSDIILIDNLEMHVYFKRHAAMVDKLLEHFPKKQFITTTHSGTLIEHVLKQYGEGCLFDLEELKKR
jgi:predicted ATPase